jgi:hypothetical protein
LWDCGFHIILGDALNGDLASFDVSAEELPAAGDRLWELASRHVPGLGQMAAVEPDFSPAEKVVPLSRIIAGAAPDDIFLVDAVQDPVMEAEVLAYALVSTNGQCETAAFRHLYLEPAEAHTKRLGDSQSRKHQGAFNRRVPRRS